MHMHIPIHVLYTRTCTSKGANLSVYFKRVDGQYLVSWLPYVGKHLFPLYYHMGVYYGCGTLWSLMPYSRPEQTEHTNYSTLNLLHGQRINACQHALTLQCWVRRKTEYVQEVVHFHHTSHTATLLFMANLFLCWVHKKNTAESMQHTQWHLQGIRSHFTALLLCSTVLWVSELHRNN